MNRTRNTVSSPLAKTPDSASLSRGCDLAAKIGPSSIQSFLNQSFMFTFKALLVKSDEAAVNRVSENMVQSHFAPWLA